MPLPQDVFWAGDERGIPHRMVREGDGFREEEVGATLSASAAVQLQVKKMRKDSKLKKWLKEQLKSYLAAAAILMISLSAHAQCGVERRDVKTLTDSAAGQVHPKVADSTVEALRHLKAPGKWGGNLARLPAEQQSYRVSALLLGYKLEADGDYHVVISSPASVKQTMIAEIPSPECATKRAEEFKSEREALTKLAKPRAKGGMRWFDKPVKAELVGVLFFDKLHGQTGVAPNGAELHPLLRMVVSR